MISSSTVAHTRLTLVVFKEEPVGKFSLSSVDYMLCYSLFSFCPLSTRRKINTKMSRSTILKYEWTDEEDKEMVKEYKIEKTTEGKIYFDGRQIPIKVPDDFDHEERTAYEEEKSDGYDNEHSLLKACLANFFCDEKGKADDETYPHFGGDAVMYEITDAIILRVWSNKHLQENYIVSKDLWRVRSEESKKFFGLPTCGSELARKDFNKILDLLE